MRRGKPATTHIATYAVQLSLLSGAGDITDDFSTKEITAENDERAVEIAEGYRKALEEIELLEPCSPDMEKKVILISVRNQKNKRLIQFVGGLY